MRRIPAAHDFFVRELQAAEMDAVSARVFSHADLVDRADVACREVQRNKALQLGNPNAPALHVTCCQRFVLMFECETLCALSLRLPVISLLAMGRGGERRRHLAICQAIPLAGEASWSTGLRVY